MNPKHPKPSDEKIRNKLAAWKRWGELMTMLREIHREIEPRLVDLRARYETLDIGTKSN